MSVEAPADAIFGYVSDPANVPAFLPEAEGAQFRTDPERRELEWTGEKNSGTIQVDTGDVTSEVSEITLRLALSGGWASDVPSPKDEQTLERMDQALQTIRKHVEHVHRARKANFM